MTSNRRILKALERQRRELLKEIRESRPTTPTEERLATRQKLARAYDNDPDAVRRRRRNKEGKTRG